MNQQADPFKPRKCHECGHNWVGMEWSTCGECARQGKVKGSIALEARIDEQCKHLKYQYFNHARLKKLEEIKNERKD